MAPLATFATFDTQEGLPAGQDGDGERPAGLMFQRPAMKVTELPADTVDGSCEILHQAGYPLVNIQKTMVAITIL